MNVNHFSFSIKAEDAPPLTIVYICNGTKEALLCLWKRNHLYSGGGEEVRDSYL